MSQQFSVPLQMAYRTPGSSVIVPSVIHSKLNHYSALTQTRDGRYLLEDTSLNTQVWISKSVVDSESSGYFLVPSGNLPSGWRAVMTNEAASVWGSGQCANKDSNCPCSSASSGCGGACWAGGDSADANAAAGGIGMPIAAIDLHQCTLLIRDTPFLYTPPVGPSIGFSFSIDPGDLSIPSFPSFANMGPQSASSVVSYIEYTPTNLTTAGVTVFARGGGVEPYQASWNTTTNATVPYILGRYTGASLAAVTNYQAVATNFTRTYPDGTQEIYAINGPLVSSNFARAFLQQPSIPVVL